MAILKLTQITDLHLGPTADYLLHGVNTLASLQAVLQAIDRQGRESDLLLLTGDLASDCQPAAYRQLDQLLTENSRRAVWLPGNHDDVAAMQQNLIHYSAMSTFESGNWGILTLDSSQVGQPGGCVADRQLQQIEKDLERLADKFVLVAMHHSPILINSVWLDRQRIVNQKQLHRLLSSHGNVKAVVTGHIHQQYEGDWEGLPVYSTPSTCVQFQQFADQFALSDQPPGYRWFDLHDDGHIDTAVAFVDNFNRL
ncbi:MAG: phosphodiesterase [Porticoccaceae bacterium]|nr:phosphodiesterase [Porticoccaceae bacterium]